MIAGVILAAGASSRMGSPKALLNTAVKRLWDALCACSPTSATR